MALVLCLLRFAAGVPTAPDTGQPLTGVPTPRPAPAPSPAPAPKVEVNGGPRTTVNFDYAWRFQEGTDRKYEQHCTAGIEYVLRRV